MLQYFWVFLGWAPLEEALARLFFYQTPKQSLIHSCLLPLDSCGFTSKAIDSFWSSLTTSARASGLTPFSQRLIKMLRVCLSIPQFRIWEISYRAICLLNFRDFSTKTQTNRLKCHEVIGQMHWKFSIEAWDSLVWIHFEVTFHCFLGILHFSVARVWNCSCEWTVVAPRVHFLQSEFPVNFKNFEPELSLIQAKWNLLNSAVVLEHFNKMKHSMMI